MKYAYYVAFIKTVSSLAFACALFQTFKYWNSYQLLAVLSSAFIHLPMSGFGTSSALLTVKTNPIFSFIATAFACLNASLV